MAAISIGGQIFMQNFLGFDDNLVCDFTQASASTFSGIGAVFQGMTDRASCLAKIDEAFAIQDLNKDGLVSRCEDAMLQHYLLGSTKEYATKFSGEFNKAGYRKICNENFSITGPNPQP